MDSSLTSSLSSPFNSVSATAHTAAYTDLNSLNAIKNEENQDEALKKVAKQFESLFMHELLKNMRKANSAFEENNLFDNKESNFFRDMYDQQLSVTLSERGMGLSDVLYRQMQSSYGQASDHTKKTSDDTPVKFGTDHAPVIRPKSALQTGEVRSTQTKPAESIVDNLFETAEDFIDSVLPMAKKAAASLGLDPLMMIAQSALETGWGKHIIQDEKGGSSNNLFNIKADSSWKGEKVAVSSLEFRDGIPVKEKSFFRKYESVEASVNDFLSFISNNPRYQQAIDVAHDGQQFIQNLHESGYATDPEYANKILSVFKGLTNKLASSAVGEGR